MLQLLQTSLWCKPGALRDCSLSRGVCLFSGRTVSSKCWEVSRHVAHAVANAEEYWALVDGFTQQHSGAS